MKLGFLGTGKMATAIAKGVVDNGLWAARDIYGFDICEQSLESFCSETGAGQVGNLSQLVDAVDVLILAVKPQNMPDAIQCSHVDFKDTLIISIAAGLKLKKLCGWFGHDRVVRVMPNTPAMVGRGAAVFACADAVTDADREVARSIFDAVGMVHVMEEEKLDAVTALSGSGPAYVFEMIQALVEAAVEVGLDREAALDLTVQTLSGAADMVARRMGTPDELRDAVTSKGGTTAAGLQVLKDAGFRKIIADVVRAARDRSVELGADY